MNLKKKNQITVLQSNWKRNFSLTKENGNKVEQLIGRTLI